MMPDREPPEHPSQTTMPRRRGCPHIDITNRFSGPLSDQYPFAGVLQLRLGEALPVDIGGEVEEWRQLPLIRDRLLEEDD
jgi:hypothetical protein